MFISMHIAQRSEAGDASNERMHELLSMNLSSLFYDIYVKKTDGQTIVNLAGGALKMIGIPVTVILLWPSPGQHSATGINNK